MNNEKPGLLLRSLFHFLYFISFFTLAQKPIQLIPSTGNLINQHVLVYHTPYSLSGDKAWEHIQEGLLASTDLTLNPGMAFPLDSYWVVFKFDNTTDLEEVFLEIDYPQMDFIELFKINDSEVKLLHTTGDNFIFDERPIVARNFILPIKLDSAETGTFLVHFRKLKSTMRFPMYLHTESSYTSKHFNSTLWFSIYFGFILLVAIMALVIGFIIKNNTFKIYSFYVIAFAFWLFTRLGYSYQFFIPNAIELNRHLLSACGQLAMMALVTYVMLFFNTKKTLPKFHKVMTFILLFFLVGYFFWGAFPERFVHYATKLFLIRYTLFSTIIIFAFTAAIHNRKLNRFRSNMFLLAYSTFLLAIIGKIFMDYGIFHEVKLGFDPIMLGYLIEVMVLSTTMALILKNHVKKNSEIAMAHDKLKEQLDRKEQFKGKDFIKLNSKAIIELNKISYIKSDDHYLEFYLSEGKKEIDRNTLAQIAETLPIHFIQTHRSFIVNTNEMKAVYADKILMKNGDEVKLSRKNKKKFQEQLKID